MGEVWLSPAQVVAINLRRARELRGMTQEKAAVALEPYLGTRWSKASFSAAEAGSLKGDKIRQFGADDLLAFSQAFDLPIAWFFVPPVTWEDQRVRIKRPEAGEGAALTPAAVIDLVFDRPQELTDLLAGTLARIPEDERTQRQRDWTTTPASVLGEVLDSLSDVDQLVQSLRDVADLLIEAREKYAQDAEAALGAEMQADNVRDRLQ